MHFILRHRQNYFRYEIQNNEGRSPYTIHYTINPLKDKKSPKESLVT